mgnify:CR=1 FL=1
MLSRDLGRLLGVVGANFNLTPHLVLVLLLLEFMRFHGHTTTTLITFNPRGNMARWPSCLRRQIRDQGSPSPPDTPP